MTAPIAGPESRHFVRMRRVVDYWRHNNTRVWRGHLRATTIGWGEPFCFACGWLAPVNDTGGWSKAWQRATQWFDIAHLQDHVYGGPDEPANLIPLDHLCHQRMPSFETRDDAIAWVKAEPLRDYWWQCFTDTRFPSDRKVQVSRSTTLLRAHHDYLEAQLVIARGES